MRIVTAVALSLALTCRVSDGWSQSAPSPAIRPAASAKPESSGRYRLSVAGFRVNRPTADDPLNRDGWGDEVYASVVLQRFDRASGALLEARTVSSRTHGDPTRFPDRVPQGHASDAGGLTAGDVVPFGWDERSPRPAVELGRFPLVVWEGSLADGGDVLVLRPTLWELDGDRAAFDYWTRLLASAAAATWALPGAQQALRTAVAAPVVGIGRGRDAYLLGTGTGLNHRSVAGPRDAADLSPGRDRPIGLRDQQWYDEILVLDREKIEGQLARGDPLIRLRLLEDLTKGGAAATNGDYTLYLRAERVP